jgi:hypothetical protein
LVPEHSQNYGDYQAKTARLPEASQFGSLFAAPFLLHLA